VTENADILDKLINLRRILMLWSVGMIIFGIGFIAWAFVFDARSSDAIQAIRYQADVSAETNRAIVRLTDRMDDQVQSMVLIRDRVVALERDVDHLERFHHNGGSDAGGSDADAQR